MGAVATRVRICSVEGCNQPFHARGCCRKHYLRWRSTGDPLVRNVYASCVQCHREVEAQNLPRHHRACQREEVRTCSVEGCEKPLLARGLCDTHYARRWREANPEQAKNTNRQWHRDNAERISEVARRWKASNPERVREFERRKSTARRRELLLAYGDGSCASCGCRPDDPTDLELDHVNGGGRKHREQVTGRDSGRSNQFAQRLKRAGWPNDPPLQTLCAPCHKAKTKYECRERNGLSS
jgi:hypothetical protein